MTLVMLCLGFVFYADMPFKNEAGDISHFLQYTGKLSVTVKTCILSAVVVIIACVVAVVLYKISKWIAKVMVLALTIVSMLFSIISFVTINSTYKSYLNNISTIREHEIEPFTLSVNGENVVVIVLDRAFNAQLPYIFAENEELYSKFDGFTYYPNTMSYGAHTNFAMPAVYGGYDYTPSAMNARSDELLGDKHNEACKVLPSMFSSEGFLTTVINPAYAGYSWLPDLSIFDDLNNVTAYRTGYEFNEEGKSYYIQSEKLLTRNLFCYGFMNCMPSVIRPILYNDGTYNAVKDRDILSHLIQIINDRSTATGFSSDFMNSYCTLKTLSSLTEISDGADNTFLIFTSDITHDTQLLDEPSYTPQMEVNNTEFDRLNEDRFILNGVTLNSQYSYQMTHYQSLTSALYLLGDWFDYLRENDLYDNTRIIIVSDHGFNLGQIDSYIGNVDQTTVNAEMVNPLLMVKDFNQTGFTVNEEFMTNADTAYLAIADVLENNINPYTGNEISMNGKEYDNLITLSDEHNVSSNNGNTFLPGMWYSVTDDVRYLQNWEYAGEW